MIQLITFQERNERTGKMETLVSYGVDTNTGLNVVTSVDRPQDIGGIFDADHGWHIPEASVS